MCFLNKMNTVSPLRRVIRVPQVHKCLSLFSNNYNIKSKEHDTSPAINEAEKVVGYPTSFLSLRWLLNDEIANVALYLRKLIGTNHPLLSTARDLIINKQSPNWGLIVLLVSKACGVKKEFSHADCDNTAGILHSQRVLAEVTEMIRTSNMIHKSIISIVPNDPNFSDLNFGNKLSLLIGDYLLSTSFAEMAGLKNHDLDELLFTCMRDFTDGQFIEPRDKQNKPLPAPPLKEQKDIAIPNQFNTEVFRISEALGNAKAEWTLRQILDGGSLLAKSCKGTLMLAEHPEPFQNLGYEFGRNIALACQASRDQKIFENITSDKFSLVCAPVLFHIQFDPSYHNKIMEYSNSGKTNYSEIRKVVRSGPGLKKTAELQEEFSVNALKILNKFPDTEARGALVNIINSLQ